jgi:alpha-tubulin suppressor-like RCC1 family protein
MGISTKGVTGKINGRPCFGALAMLLLGCAGAPSSKSVGVGVGSHVLQVHTWNGCWLQGGEVQCWGDNSAGELGLGFSDMGPHDAPAPVVGAPTLAAISVGGAHVCGLDPHGVAYCWGGNDFGQCGPGCSATPTAMYPDHQFTSLSAGRTHTCALDASGMAFCWGSNAQGALGSNDPSMPARVAGGPFVAIGADQDNTCALNLAGDALCWGVDDNGQLGSGSGIPPEVCPPDGSPGLCMQNEMPFPPTPVAGGHTFTALAVNALNVCALDATGVGWCWGDNSDGQLTSSCRALACDAPVQFQVPAGVVLKQILGMWPICGLATTGDVYCAGTNRYGALGQGTADNDPHPIAARVPGLPPVASLAGADNFDLCALTISGERYCWGNNGSGHLGDGTEVDRWSPERIP